MQLNLHESTVSSAYDDIVLHVHIMYKYNNAYAKPLELEPLCLPAVQAGKEGHFYRLMLKMDHYHLTRGSTIN